jgi:branched-chain amino acid transport system permease protein
MDIIAKALVLGLTEQAPMILAAIGMAVMMRLSGVISIAYAEVMTLGAYIGCWFNNTFGWNFYLCLIPAGLGGVLVSVASYFILFRPALRRGVGSMEIVIMSIGLSIFLRYGLQLVFGYRYMFYDVPPPQYIRILGVGVTTFQMTALGVLVGLALLLMWFIQKTNYGQQMRALASDEKLAQASGINPLAVTTMIWGFTGLAGGLAGAFFGQSSSVGFNLGWGRFLLVILVVLVGGTRNLLKVILAGIATGILLSGISLATTPLYAQVALLTLFIILLALRQGNRLSGEAGKV